MRVAFLGPSGTYGEQAARRFARLEAWEPVDLVPCPTIRAVVEGLAVGDCEAAVVPVENSVEGGVTAALDALWTHRDLAITRALVLPIRHALLGEGPLEGVSEVLSHPQALAQCSQWLADHCPRALQLPTASTAEAARMVRGSRFRAAIASQEAAREQQLPVLAYPVNDIAGNCTRFLLLQRGARADGGPIASLAFSLHANRPGALLEALACFARFGLNMSRIESRPSKREMGEYLFFVDLELAPAELSSPAAPEGRDRGDGVDPAQLQQVLQDLEPLCEHLALFGSYPITGLDQAEEPAEIPG
jgi:prephenate dehydratase